MTFEAGWARAIRARAAELGLNQADLGRVLGMSKQTGHRLWKGEQKPTETQCDELEEALMISEGELRVLCGYLPKGSNPKVERGEGQIIVRLDTPVRTGGADVTPIIHGTSRPQDNRPPSRHKEQLAA